MGDLYVAVESIEPDLRDHIRVWDTSWGVAPGLVRISHEAYSGLVETIERPSSDALPLFWRFVREKFGIERDPE